jgi:hypothetical protein
MGHIRFWMLMALICRVIIVDINRKIETLLHTGKETGLEVNANRLLERPMFISRHLNAGEKT